MSKFYGITYTVTVTCHAIVSAENEDEAVEKFRADDIDVSYEGVIDATPDKYGELVGVEAYD